MIFNKQEICTRKKINQMLLITMNNRNEGYSNVTLSVFMYSSTVKYSALYICQINDSNYCNYWYVKDITIIE